jgi:succinyl-CoA synthetase beta subunit
MIKITSCICNAFISTDALQIEINPLVTTKEGNLLALDAKINFDDNGLFRHPEIEAMRDEEEEDPLETRASKHDLSYVRMDGNIGCMVNGAGLAMSTMDIIKLHGADPANFLDVGGSADTQRVIEAFKIILSDDAVQGILVRIILNASITRCVSALPPTSRKFAGSAPCNLMISIVDIARPAPFTRHPMLPPM